MHLNEIVYGNRFHSKGNKIFSIFKCNSKSIPYKLRMENSRFCYALQLNSILIKSNINSKLSTIICHIERTYKWKRPNNFQIDLNLMLSRFFSSFIFAIQKKHDIFSSFALDYILCNVTAPEWHIFSMFTYT